MAANNITLKTSYGDNERIPDNVRADYEWIRANRAALYAKYGKGVVWVYHQQVIGFGPTQAESERNARANLPTLTDIPDNSVITPVSAHLGPNRILRLRVVDDQAGHHDAR